ncbi:HNH endonuclease signature motif containing protein [Tsukamurella paurometabola]|uniref:HNH nuclease domain-containing protein n=1 Tax=Tsukamurella paurometabola (strain ATCC 8368 / DSM 20162 / CCUG 35730 / CIP 100753 / JCM 10117 / KCTC 9821 / NBRC 16120 / NCIMB 702349 / NCTC 13040) TaxID=521096 RepID=D5UQD0_TSUPD|nr:HNH endonuclease signature motif containing protein [Tsukamurella paurometabola]ADG78900.1 protein of unknown function DUF222 [Tsukamurella paurometabola DSM 20162]SUP33459.1 Domain of uncharacterised function DUF222 [Tsukamurella paurometabola]
MSENSSGASEYLDVLTSFERAAERLAAVDPVMLTSREVLESLHRLETAARKVPYAQNSLARIAFEQDLPGQLNYTGLKEVLVDQLRLAGSEARDRMHGAVERAPRHERGVAPEPKRALIAAAQRAGRISERHATAIQRIVNSCRRRLTTTDVEHLEDILVTAATDVTPDDLTKIGKRAVDLLDPDGAEPKEDIIARARGVEIGSQDDDLMTDFGGSLSPEGRAVMSAILEKLARPGVNNPDDADAPITPADRAAIDQAAQRDKRTQAQRNHDALITALRIALGTGELGQHRGLPCIPIITLTIDQLESETGIATTATGGRLPVPDALRMMGTNPKYALLLDLASRPLFLGREKRLATRDQRIALYGSEKGCTAPGCDQPATRTQVHHVTDWADGGGTDITALTLACDKHHAAVTPASGDRSHGLETITIADGPNAGRTGWRRTADPTHRYRVNHTHHTDELHRHALEHWRRRAKQFRARWLAEDLRVQYNAVIGSTYRDISATLDGPNGPPLLEQLLAEHDADNAWRPAPPGDASPPRAA